MHQRLADQEAEHRVAQEFHLLVVGVQAGRGIGMSSGLVFMHARTVGERAHKDFPILKTIAESGLEIVQVRAHRAQVYFFESAGVAAAGGAAGFTPPPLAWMARTRSACANCLICGLTSGIA